MSSIPRDCCHLSEFPALLSPVLCLGGHAVGAALITSYAWMITKSCIRCGVMRSNGLTGSGPVRFDSCGLADLVVDALAVPSRAGEVLELGDGWARRWAAAWGGSGSGGVWPGRGLGSFPLPRSRPVPRVS